MTNPKSTYMTSMKIAVVMFLTLMITSCAHKSESYLSTVSALEKYHDLLQDQTFYAFAELRDNPLKWFDSIPEGKIETALQPSDFVLAAQPGEFYVYQVGVWGLKSDLDDIAVEFSDLTNGSGDQIIPASVMTCFNTGGIGYRGKAFTKEVNVPAGRIQALWMGVDLKGIGPGDYSGSVSVVAGGEKQAVPIRFKVSGEAVPNHGYNQGKRLSRLNWLNSNVGIDEQITKGYLPVKVEDNKITILGRSLDISANGLPSSIISHFSQSNQSLVEKGQPIIKDSVRFIIEKEDGTIIQLKPGPLEFLQQTPSKILWRVLNTSDEVDLECTAQMEFDGFVDYKLKITAKVPLKLRDIRLEIPVAKEKAEYMMGLGHEGGFRTPDWKWKWDVSKNQDMLWIGGVNGGVWMKWKAENYVRPLVNIYYKFRPLNLPPSRSNEGNGGIDIVQKNSDVQIIAYSGRRETQKGDVLNYNFELLITPFKVIDKKIKFGDRYYADHLSNPSTKIEIAKQLGANFIDIHHAEDIAPFINYPHLDQCSEELTQLVANAHNQDLRMKFYYTTRLLTKNAPEFWAFNSLDGEIIFPGPGNDTRTEARYPDGPHEWFIKNMREKYIPGWFVTIKEGKFRGELDLSLVTTPDSRLNNYYVASLDWMVQNMGVDGVYIDDTALDRWALQRSRKIIDRYRPEGRLDLHSWNHFHKWAGFASCLNLYMDLLPYFDMLWIGEGRDYNRAPDHWLIEVSGIPFGLAGQMLQDGGNPWRGMVYGITNRAGWKGSIPPTDIWKFWDNYKIENKEMIGYWDKNIPVTCNNPMVKASVYKGPGETIISVANWSDQDEEAALKIDWARIGLDPDESDVLIPEIKNFQAEQTAIQLNTISIPGKKGYLIVLKQKGD